MASSRRTGTNENISTYGGGGMGRDYTVLLTWEATMDYDLVTATTSEVLECYADSASFDDYMTMAGATCNASYRRIVRPASGECHDGTPNTGFFISSTTDAPVIRIDESYSQIQDLILSLNINSANDRLVLGGPGVFVGFIGCLIVDSENTGSGVVHGIWAWGTSNSRYIINCLVHNIAERGVFISGTVYNYFYNCTVTNCDIGFYSSSAIAYGIAKNCVPSGNTTSHWFGSWTQTTCITDGSTPTYVDSANDDFHLDVTDTVCRGNGTDLSADAIYPFDDDIDFITRVNWDIGFDDYILPAATDQPAISIMT